MPRQKARKKTRKGPGGRIGWGGMGPRPWGRANFVLGAAAAVTLVAGGLYLWPGDQANDGFGGGHLAPGQSHAYNERFPTSGIHDPVPVGPGFYRNFMAPTKLVHSLEHGHVVIYYESPGAEATQLLMDWTGLHDGYWDGVVAVPAAGLGKAVVLTAWGKIIRLDEFDPAAAAAFIDQYRGRGPENPVR